MKNDHTISVADDLWVAAQEQHGMKDPSTPLKSLLSRHFWPQYERWKSNGAASAAPPPPPPPPPNSNGDGYGTAPPGWWTAERLAARGDDVGTKMVATRNGNCTSCGGRIKRGDLFVWFSSAIESETKRANHIGCYFVPPGMDPPLDKTLKSDF